MNKQMEKDIKWLTEKFNTKEKKHETIIISKFDKEYYRNRYVASMASLSEKTTIIVDLKAQLASYQDIIWEMKIEAANKLTLTETSQLDNTGNNNNE